MGLYDRDYGRHEPRTPWDRIEQPRSMTITLIVISVVIFLLDYTTATADGMGRRASLFARWLAVEPDTLIQPWMWWQFLTYGFLHDTHGIRHILFNMFGLFVFGRMVERRMGGGEFVKFYLAAILVGGIVGSLAFWLEGLIAGKPLAQIPEIPASVIGASGAVIAVAILFACYYPHAELLLFFVLPVKAWVLAVFFIATDLAGALGLLGGALPGAGNTAFGVHLAGAAFAGLYYFRRWSFRRLDFSRLADLPQQMQQRSRRMKLKLHDPDKKLNNDAREADRILDKIHQHGESSLTSAERRTLERYSRRQRQKRGQ